MDAYIKQVKIESFFVKDRILEMDFDEDVNCIYGVNGSGKTTLINTIVASLTCDVPKLISLPFERILIYLSPAGKKRPILFLDVSKTKDSRLIVSIPENKFEESFEITNLELTPGYLKQRSTVLEHIGSRIALTYVPLTRLQEADIYDLDKPEEFFLQRSLLARHFGSDEIGYVLDPNKRMLVDLEKAFKEKYSEVQKEVKEALEKLRNKIVTRLLIDKSTVKEVKEQYPLDYLQADILTLQHQKDTETYFKKLQSVNLDVPKSQIDQHFQLFSEEVKSFQKIKELVAKKKEPENEELNEYSKNFFSVLYLSTLYRRFFTIIDDIEKSEQQKESILKIFKETEKIINSFLINKKFQFNNSGGFLITCDNREIKIGDLSSGEKHVIALLGRVSLSGTEGTVFVADEPELSLHLEWQRKIIPSIKTLAPSMQIIVATHSPAIIPDSAKMIDIMECMH